MKTARMTKLTATVHNTEVKVIDYHGKFKVVWQNYPELVKAEMNELDLDDSIRSEMTAKKSLDAKITKMMAGEKSMTKEDVKPVSAEQLKRNQW